MLFLTEAVYLASSVHNEVPQTAVIHSLFFSRPFEKKNNGSISGMLGSHKMR